MTTELPIPDHTWVHERIAASIAGGLSREEQTLFDAHIHGCSECFDAFTEARDADRWLLRAADALAPSANLEEKIIGHLREKTMKPVLLPLARRAAIGLAAAVALAATGVFAQYVLHHDFLNNPLSKQLASANNTGLPNLPFSPPELGLGGAGALDSSKKLKASLFDQSSAKGIIASESHYGTDTENSATQIVDWGALDAKGQTSTRIQNSRTTYSFSRDQTDGKFSGDSVSFGDARADGGRKRVDLDKRVSEIPTVAPAADYYQLGELNGDSRSNALAGENTYTGKTVVESDTLATTGGVVSDNKVLKDGLDASEVKADVLNREIIPLQSVDAVKLQPDPAHPSVAVSKMSPEATALVKTIQDQRAADRTYEEYRKRYVRDENRQEVQDQQEIIPYSDLLVDPNDWVNLTKNRIASADATTQPSGASPVPSPAATTQSAPVVAERKIIRSGNVEFEVRSFEDAYATISSIVTEDGGYVSSTSSDRIANGKVRGVVVVRVPPEKLDRFLLKLRALGDLKSQQIAADDVTKDYVDIESELRALRAMESRLLDLIKSGKGEVKDLVEAEKQLGDYRVRIEKLEGEIRYYNNQVAMATLTITAYEKDIQKPTAAYDQEAVTMSMETEDVEKQYLAARKILDDAKGRIIDSELKKADADQYAARIIAEVPPEQADFVAAQLKQIGNVASYNRDRKQTTAGGEGEPAVQVEHKPTQFSISLYNLANIAPRETTTLTIAVPDVDAAYRKALALVRQQTPALGVENGKLGEVPTQPRGRIVTSAITGQQPEQMTADIHADVRTDLADAVLDQLKQTGETLSSATSENPDTANTTSAKRGIQLRFVNTASVPPRENIALREVAANVPDGYNKLLAALQTLQTAGSARIVASQLFQASPQDIHGQISFEVRRDAIPSVDKAFTDAGIEPIAKNITRSNDTANTLDSKVGYQINDLLSADTLPPLRTTVLGIEIDNVEKAIETLRTALAADSAKEMEYTLAKDPNGQIIARLVVETPVKNTPAVLAHIQSLGGNEKTNQVTKNPQLPETSFTRDRFEITLSSQQALVSQDKGFAATTRSALGSAAAALLWSLWLILTGVLFLAPFLLLGWIVQKFFRRRKPAAPSA